MTRCLVFIIVSAFVLDCTVRGQKNATSTTDPCFDKTDCQKYGDKTSVCPAYQKWSEDNCRRFCGYCTPLHTTPVPPCRDTINDCDAYGVTVCDNPHYNSWARDRCKKFCGFCTDRGFHGQCNYKGRTYNTGETWSDGCDYDCECTDGQTGTYQCQNKCPIYNLPSSCRLVYKPNTCCKEVKCDVRKIQNSFVNHDPGTMANGTAVCVYRQKKYVQGQSWADGQDYHCSCIDASIGEYKCTEICATYPSLPSPCNLVNQPGTACQIPKCSFDEINTNFTGDGHLSGHGFVKEISTPPPCVDKSSNCAEYGKSVCQNFKPWARDHCIKYCDLCSTAPEPKESDRCAYHGVTFRQGERWNISCDVECICEDARYGYYRCNNRCPTFSNLPADCQAVLIKGNCCKSLYCNNSGYTNSSTLNAGSIGGSTTSSIKGVPGVALHLVHSVIQATPVSVTTQMPSSACVDKVSNCKEYTKSACSGVYLAWSKDNCRKYCNHCSTSEQCVDSTLIRCSDAHVCQDSVLSKYCPVTCGLCTPCTDATFIKCSDSHVCSEDHLKNYCPMTCGLCGKQNTVTGVPFGK